MDMFKEPYEVGRKKWGGGGGMREERMGTGGVKNIDVCNEFSNVEKYFFYFF